MSGPDIAQIAIAVTTIVAQVLILVHNDRANRRQLRGLRERYGRSHCAPH